MCGEGKRFKEKFNIPKPLVSVRGKTITEWAVESLNQDGNYIFLCRTDHLKYGLDKLLRKLKPECTILYVDHTTEGAACTALLAKPLIDSDEPLLIANCDQYIEYNKEKFENLLAKDPSGIIFTFGPTQDPKWSYAALSGNRVMEVAETDPTCSEWATCGIYAFRQGRDFVKYAEQMIRRNIRTNNEYYLCPAYNEFIDDGKLIMSLKVDTMVGLGDVDSIKLFEQTSG